MNALEPINKHPLVWILADLFGISVGEISRRSKITRPRIARLNQLSPPSPDETSSLLALVKSSLRTLETMPHPPYYKRPPFLDDYYTATISLIRRYIELHTITAVPKPRRTELTDLILANITATGTRETQVLAALQLSFSVRAIREAADRIGVRRVARGNIPYWYPPPSAPTPTSPIGAGSPLIDRPITPPRTERQRKCRDQILRCLEKAPDNTLAYRDIISRIAHFGFSHQLIRSSIYELTLIVETSGFGPAKKTMVGLPHKYRVTP